jgi:uncharacterized repeat protein (TIGR01451 family)
VGSKLTNKKQEEKAMASFTNQATLSYNNITVSSNIVTGSIIDVLAAAKTAVSASYSIGEPVTYAVSLVNSGTAALTGLTVTDDLGAYEYGTLTLVPLTYVAGSVKYFVNGVLQPAPTVTVGDTLAISGISVPAGGDAVILYQAVPNEYASPESGASVTNTASVAGSGVSAVSASATVPAEEAAVLAVSKALSPAEVAENGQLTYTFVIQNTGNTPEDGAILSDTFTPVLSGITVAVDGTARTTTDYTYDELTGEFATTAGAFTVPAATYTQDTVTGAYSEAPGLVTITISGTV